MLNPTLACTHEASSPSAANSASSQLRAKNPLSSLIRSTSTSTTPSTSVVVNLIARSLDQRDTEPGSSIRRPSTTSGACSPTRLGRSR